MFPDRLVAQLVAACPTGATFGTINWRDSSAQGTWRYHQKLKHQHIIEFPVSRPFSGEVDACVPSNSFLKTFLLYTFVGTQVKL